MSILIFSVPCILLQGKLMIMQAFRHDYSDMVSMLDRYLLEMYIWFGWFKVYSSSVIFLLGRKRKETRT